MTKVIELVESKKFKIINIDAIIICQSPRLSEFIPKMIENIAVDCKCEESQVNIKATTTEMMGFIGRSEGIAGTMFVLNRIILIGSLILPSVRPAQHHFHHHVVVLQHKQSPLLFVSANF